MLLYSYLPCVFFWMFAFKAEAKTKNNTWVNGLPAAVHHITPFGYCGHAWPSRGFFLSSVFRLRASEKRLWRSHVIEPHKRTEQNHILVKNTVWERILFWVGPQWEITNERKFVNNSFVCRELALHSHIKDAKRIHCKFAANQTQVKINWKEVGFYHHRVPLCCSISVSLFACVFYSQSRACHCAILANCRKKKTSLWIFQV